MNTTEVKSILRKLQPFVNHKSFLPVLRCLRIRSEEYHFRFDVTDLGHYVSYPLYHNIQTEGLAAHVDFASFQEAIASLDAGHFDLHTDNAMLVIEAGDSTISLPSEDLDFPDVPPLGDFCMAISVQLLFQITERVAPFNALAFDPKGGRPSLEQVQLKIEYPGLTVTAADGFKLARLETEAVEHFWAEDQELLIPAQKLDKILALAGGNGMNGLEMVRVFSRKAEGDICMVGFEFANGVRVSAVGPPFGTHYPDADQIIPKESEATFTFNVEELQKALKAMSFIFKAQDNKKFGARMFKLTVQPEQAIAKLEAKAEGKIVTRDVKLVGMPAAPQEIVASISPDHLDIILKAAQGEEIAFHTGPNRSQYGGCLSGPMVLRVNGNQDWLAVLMPIVVTS